MMRKYFTVFCAEFWKNDVAKMLALFSVVMLTVMVTWMVFAQLETVNETAFAIPFVTLTVAVLHWVFRPMVLIHYNQR